MYAPIRVYVAIAQVVLLLSVLVYYLEVFLLAELRLRTELVCDGYVLCLVRALFDVLHRGLAVLCLANVSQWTVIRTGSTVCYLALPLVG